MLETPFTYTGVDYPSRCFLSAVINAREPEPPSAVFKHAPHSLGGPVPRTAVPAHILGYDLPVFVTCWQKAVSCVSLVPWSLSMRGKPGGCVDKKERAPRGYGISGPVSVGLHPGHVPHVH